MGIDQCFSGQDLGAGGDHMKITISGMAGSGKSTVAKIVAKELGLKHHSIGDFMREIAQEKGMTLPELSAAAESDRWLDEKLDQKQIALGKYKDDFILDSRLGYHFIPDSLKVFLYVDMKTGAERILGAHRSEETAESVEAMVDSMQKRLNSEKKRYRQYYGIDDYTHKSNYEVYIDTSRITAEEAARRLIECVTGKAAQHK